MESGFATIRFKEKFGGVEVLTSQDSEVDKGLCSPGKKWYLFYLLIKVISTENSIYCSMWGSVLS